MTTKSPSRAASRPSVPASRTPRPSCASASSVATLAGPYDCVFFDADRRSGPEQLALLLPKLTADALILADNALSHPEEIAAYLAAVAALPDVDHLVVPVGKGLSVAYRGASR